MEKLFSFLLWFLLLLMTACGDDNSYKKQTFPEETGKISLALTGRIGTVVGKDMTTYIKSLDLFLFRENGSGNYVLFRNVSLTKAAINALTDASGENGAGFTNPKLYTFDTVPVANYKIVGVGNLRDSVGQALPNMRIEGVSVGNAPSEMVVSVLEGDQASRIFWGETRTIQVGAEGTNLPVLSLYRKVAMFALTLEKIPNVVNRIDMEISNTYGQFDMNGSFQDGRGIVVYGSNSYRQQVQDSITLTYVTFPTVAGESSSFLTTFYLVDGPKQPVVLPEYVLKPNTITKVTATIDPDQEGNRWKVDVSSLITVDVEWNVDQEPPITI